jgi:hypothetical protein
MPRALLLLPATDYRTEYFATVAYDMNVELVFAADGNRPMSHVLGTSRILVLPFDQPELAAEQLASLEGQLDAVVAIDDHGAELAAQLIERRGLAGNSLTTVRASRDKLAFRQLQKSYAFNHPNFQVASSKAEGLALAPSLQYPVVVKGRWLSAGQGVIRVDDAIAYVQAIARVCRIQAAAANLDAAEPNIIVESFIPGSQHALEGLLQDGALRVMAMFDEPDPLDGPYFEETIYVTPSRLPPSAQATIAADVQQACALAGLTSGPVHAEMRVNTHGVWLLDVGPRAMGNLCSRMRQHRLGMTLEELILRNGLRLPLPISPDDAASGLMMIPIPERGIFHGVTGLEAARAVSGILDIVITAQPGQSVIPPPEGSGNLGFIFSRAITPEEAEAALRDAHLRLGFDIRAELPVTPA